MLRTQAFLPASPLPRPHIRIFRSRIAPIVRADAPDGDANTITSTRQQAANNVQPMPQRWYASLGDALGYTTGHGTGLATATHSASSTGAVRSSTSAATT